MIIKEIELFDLYGDGTLVMKTNVDTPTEDLRYTWYVKLNGQLIHKAGYQRNPFTAIHIDHLGKYVVKAFVRDANGEKVEEEVVFVANKKTSPQLAMEETKPMIIAKADHISGAFWQFSAEGEIPENAKYAWYLYKKDVSEPIFRGAYVNTCNFVYNISESGEYLAKLFVLSSAGEKYVVVTDYFIA